MMGRIRDAARRARAETAIRRVLSENGLEGDVTLRSLDGRMTASVVLASGAAANEADLENRLAEASGLDRVTVVMTSHQGAGSAARSSRQDAPASPGPRGGHADPLHLGGRQPKERSGPKKPEGVKAVVAIASGKGGVGKSTVAARLALELASRKLKVGLLDLDIHGPSLPVLFPVTERLRSEDGNILPAEADGLKLVSVGYMIDERKAVAWRGPMVMNAARQLIEDTAWGELDVLVVDTPPGTGDAHLSMVQRLAIDKAVLVATPSPLATADVRRGAELFRTTGTSVLGIVLNMTGGPMGDDIDAGLLAELELEILERIPVSAATAAVPLDREEGANLSATADHVLEALSDVLGDRSG